VRITLNRPEVTNALSIRLSDDLLRAFEYLRDSTAVKVFVITGAGGNFCAGDDLTEMGSGAWGDANAVMRRVRTYQHMANSLEELDKITVAAVDGFCVGGGLKLTMACDFRHRYRAQPLGHAGGRLGHCARLGRYDASGHAHRQTHD
jgi:enoyl-CoA hydratase